VTTADVMSASGHSDVAKDGAVDAIVYGLMYSRGHNKVPVSVPFRGVNVSVQRYLHGVETEFTVPCNAPFRFNVRNIFTRCNRADAKC